MTDVYRAYAAGGELLYIGVAENWARRWAGHASHSPWFGSVARLEIERFALREEALAREAELIRDFKPPHNIGSYGPGRCGKPARSEREYERDVLGVLRAGPAASVNAIAAAVEGKRQRVLSAARRLMERGAVVRDVRGCLRLPLLEAQP